MKKIILLFILLSKLSFGQYIDTVRHDRHNLSLFVSGQFNNNINGGLFYTGANVSDRDKYYKLNLLSPMFSASLGVKYKNIFQTVDFSLSSKKSDLVDDNFKIKYYGYQAWYDFFKKYKFPVKPLLSINLAYVDERYSFVTTDAWGGGYSNISDLSDISKTFLIQVPVGVYFYYKNIYLSAAYNIPVFAWAKGTYTDSEQSSYLTQHYSQITHTNFSGNSANRDYYKQTNVFSIRLGYTIKL